MGEPLTIVPPGKTSKKLEYCLPNLNSTICGRKTAEPVVGIIVKKSHLRFGQSFQDLMSLFGTILNPLYCCFFFISLLDVQLKMI